MQRFLRMWPRRMRMNGAVDPGDYLAAVGVETVTDNLRCRVETVRLQVVQIGMGRRRPRLGRMQDGFALPAGRVGMPQILGAVIRFTGQAVIFPTFIHRPNVGSATGKDNRVLSFALRSVRAAGMLAITLYC